MEFTLIIKQSIVSSTEFLLDNEKQRNRRSQLCELKARQNQLWTAGMFGFFGGGNC